MKTNMEGSEKHEIINLRLSWRRTSSQRPVL